MNRFGWLSRPPPGMWISCASHRSCDIPDKNVWKPKSCPHTTLSCACRTPLHAAAFAEDVSGLQLVLRHGAEINAVDKGGHSALMVAADKGHSGTVGTSSACWLPAGRHLTESWVSQKVLVKLTEYVKGPLT